MKIEYREFKLRDIADGYVNNEEEGCFALLGNLDIRPAYQREFVYKDDKRDAVIDTIIHGYPLNIMYWVRVEDNKVPDDDLTGKYEILDGQQRTISFCEYLDGNFSVPFNNDKNDLRYYFSLSEEERKKIDNYPITVYICSGEDDEKMAWFERINVAGEPLTPQEIRNALHTGSWLYDAKKYFSKSDCLCKKLYEPFMGGRMNRQEWLETALIWICDRDKLKLNEYMSLHQQDQDASELWQYFGTVMDWVNRLYLNNEKKLYLSKMKGIDWGLLYNRYGTKQYNYSAIIAETEKLFENQYITNQKGIFEYVLSDHTAEDYRLLCIRMFDDDTKTLAYNSTIWTYTFLSIIS